MKVLVLNCGSSSIKYQFIDTTNQEALATGLVERIGMSSAVLSHKPAGRDKIKIVGEILDHKIGIEYVIAVLLNSEYGVIKDKKEIDAVGHRVVHGGETFSGSVLITEQVVQALNDNIELAPLHNPPNISGIDAAKSHLPNVPQCGVFDTAFHSNMPPKAYLYGLPYELYTKYKVRRYGFHGTSHRYVSERAAAMLGKPIENLKIITCHLGNGASIAAIKDGISVDTSMGFTPLEGLLMGTRSGDVDLGAILYVMGKEGLNLAEVNTLINKHSGIAGLSGLSSDMRDIEGAYSEGENKQAMNAFDAYNYRIKKYIGAYAAAMGGCDALVFTGGVGENSSITRKIVCEDLNYMGLVIDNDKNDNFKRGEEVVISADDTRSTIMVIPTNEELVIALDTEKIVNEELANK